jgi:predicted kinase
MLSDKDYQITVLMGAPGAGKSTWVKSNRANEYIYTTEGVRIDRDLDVSEYMYQQRRLAIKAVEAGSCLIADGTHTIHTHRAVWLNLAKRLGLSTRLIAFVTPLPTLLAVQESRLYPAPNAIVRTHHHRMNRALQLINKEGWDHIEIIRR